MTWIRGRRSIPQRKGACAMSDKIETGTWRIEDINNTYNRMGIPHFQRGPVWNDSMAALLLESVYFGTPCGTIILWQPTDPRGRARHCATVRR